MLISMVSKIRIGLFGFGRTGKIIASEIIKYDDEFVLSWVVKKSIFNTNKFAGMLLGFNKKVGRIHSVCDLDSSFFEKNKVDVIVDFSGSSGVNYYAPYDLGRTKIISAISKYEKNDLKKLLSLGKKTTVVYSPNITLGINVLLILSKIVKTIIPWADVEIYEEHFRNKKEISGTAIKIAKSLSLNRKNVHFVRAGGIVGKHEVIFGLPNQTLRITHESINRAAFGQGVIFAIKWIIDKKKGVYMMDKIISEKVKEAVTDL